MVRAEIINQVAQNLDTTKRRASIAVNTVFKSIATAMARGEKIELRGFGSFTIRRRNARAGRNPKTAQMVRVKAKKVPFFKAGKDLKIVS